MKLLEGLKNLKAQPYRLITAILIGILFFINGCGIVPASTNLKSSTFINKLDEEKHGLNPKDDAVLLASHSFDRLPIVKSSGERAVIDFSQQPVIFVAYWCPGCQRELVLLNENKEKLDRLPVLICTGFNKNSSLDEAVKIIEQEFQELKVQGFITYYSLTAPSKKDVPQYPAVIYPKGEAVFRLTGEHTFDVLSKAINH